MRDIHPLTRAAIDEALGKGLSALAIEKPRLCSEWAAENFWIADSRKGATAGRFKPYAYQVGLLDLLGNDAVRTVTVQKAARLGVSIILEAGVAYALAHRKRSVALYCDCEDERDQTVKDQYHPMIEMVPPLRSQQIGLATLDKARFVGGSLHTRAGKAKRAYQRISVDWVIYEELDRFDDNIGGSDKGVRSKKSADRGEGSPVALGDTRITQSPFGKSIRNSSPSVKGLSKIAAEIEQADVVLSYHVPCARCGDVQLLEWGGPDVDYGIKWDLEGDKPVNVRYQCRSCGDHFSYAEMIDNLPGGRWQTVDGDVQLGEGATFWSGDKQIAAPEHVGILQDCLISPDISWRTVVREFGSANRRKKSGDVGALKTFTNTRLNQLWEEVPELEHKASEYLARLEHCEAYAPKGVKALFLGADLHPDRLEYTIRGFGAGRESWVLEYGVITGSPESDALWDSVQRIIDTAYDTEDGRSLNILISAIDAGHSGTNVHKFARRPGNLTRVVPVFGSSHKGAGKPIASPPRKPVGKHRTYLTEVGTDNAKDRIFYALSIEHAGDRTPGYIHFLQERGLGDAYFKGLIESETRVLRASRGKMVFTWETVKDGVRNEPLDTMVYTEAALEFWIERMGGDLDTYEGRPEITTETGESAASRLGALAAKING